MTTPLFQEFNPKRIPWQWEATKYIRNFDYKLGALELFYSGGVGSAKTIDHVHEIVKDCLEQPNSRWLMIRKVLKDLKRTSWAELLRHMADISPLVVRSYNKTEMKISFHNGSEIYGDSYDDGDITKFQSMNLSGLDIEEANEMESKEIYEGIKLRIGRAGVEKNKIFIRTNPDEPTHWLYKYFITDSNHPNKKVFYSLTEQNPFLPSWYLENLKRDLDPLMARRKLYGEWISIFKEHIYYNYKRENNFRDYDYIINPNYPIDLMHDFNIGKNKPMSSCLGQNIDGCFHVFKVFHVDGARTLDILEEMDSKFRFPIEYNYRVFGDASGSHNDTRSKVTDWDIVERFLSQKNLRYEMCVPKSNPPIRRRHNIVNASFLNENNKVRYFQYKGTDWLDDGWRLTSFKKGGSNIEDDSLPNQHATTAVGYWIDYIHYRVSDDSHTIKL